MSDTERFWAHLDDLYVDGTHLEVTGRQTIGIPIGRTVVANGCFDVLHPGHLRLLEQLDHLAYAHRLRPIVAINSDDSVRRLKGATRPIVPAAGRARLINTLRWPFTVIIFGEESPQRLMDLLRPKIVLKGGQYEGDVVRWSGSEVVKVDMVAGWSTTGMVGTR